MKNTARAAHWDEFGQYLGGVGSVLASKSDPKISEQSLFLQKLHVQQHCVCISISCTKHTSGHPRGKRVWSMISARFGKVVKEGFVETFLFIFATFDTDLRHIVLHVGISGPDLDSSGLWWGRSFFGI